MNKTKGVAYAILSSSTFGLIPLFAIPALNAGIGINSVLFYRFGLSALILGVLLFAKKYDMKVTPKELGILSVLGILYGSTAILLTSSYLYIPSGIATTIHFLYPVIVTLTMAVFFKEKISTPLITAIVMAIGGVCLLSCFGESGEINAKGILLVLITIFTYAFYIVGVNKSAVSEMDGLKMTFYVLLSGSAVFGFNLLAHGEPLDTHMSMNTAAHLLLLALVPTIVSDLTLILAVQHVGSTTTAVLGCMEPLTALVVGNLVFDEKFNWMQAVGVTVVLTAVTIVILSNRKQATKEQNSGETR